MDELVDDPRAGHRLEVQARLAELDADALDVADQEALADEVVQPHAANDDLPARLRARQPDVLERLGLDQRQRPAGPLALRAEVAVALEPAPGDGAHEVDRRERVRRADRRSPRTHLGRSGYEDLRRELAQRSDDRVRLATASPGGKCGFGIATHRIPAALAERMPLCESSIAAHAAGVDAEPARGLEVDVRRRLAARDLLGGDGRRKSAAIPPASSTRSISSRFDDDASPRAKPAASRRTASTAPGSQRRPSRVALEHPRARPRRLISSGGSASPIRSCM